MKTVFSLSLATVMLLSGAVAGSAPPHGDKLPPGLQKKVERGGELPPGWKKKLREGETLDKEVYEHGRVVARDENGNEVTIKVEDKLIKVIEDTHTIVEILDDY